MKRRHVRKVLLLLFGVLFIVFGIGAFFGVPGGHDAAHHSIGHNVTHLIAGVTILAVAWAGDSRARRRFSLLFGLIYLAIGIFGAYSVRDSLRIIPGLLEFHLEDNWVQIGTGVLFLALAALKSKPISTYSRRLATT